MKKTLFAILLALVITACGATANMGSKIKKVELGMSRHQVTSILGNSYTMEGAVQGPNGGITIISYNDLLYPDNYYLFHFENDKLVEWHKEYRPGYNSNQGGYVD